MRAMTRRNWFLPLFSLGLGVACLVAFWLGGNPGQGLASLGVMAGLGVVFLIGGRSDLIRGPWRRSRRVLGADRRARTALAGIVVITAVIGMCLWEWGHGRDGSPYSQLGAIGGVAYVAAIIGLRARS